MFPAALRSEFHPVNITVLIAGNATDHDEKISAKPVADLSLATRVCLATVLVATMIVAVLGNSVVCLLVYRKTAMRSAINLIVAQLALSDILLSILVMSFALAGLFLPKQWCCRREMCALESFLHEILVTLNVCLLLIVSLDRYLIIVHRQEKLNVRRARIFIVLAWCFSVVTSVGPLLGWGRFALYPGHPQCLDLAAHSATELSFVVVFCLVTRYAPLAAILSAYACILRTVKRKSMKVHHYSVDLGVTCNSRSTLPTLQPRISVTGALRELSPDHFSVTKSTPSSMISRIDGLSGISSFSSASPVCFVSSNSTVYLHATCQMSAVLGFQTQDSPSDVSRDVFPLGQLSSSENSKSLSDNPVSADSFGEQSNPVKKSSFSSPYRTKEAPWNSQQGIPPYLSSPSGFSPAARSARRSAGARRQVLDMSLKTRAFKTILILSLLMCVCWLPYITAMLVTSLAQLQRPVLLCFLLWLGFVKSALNPVVYCLRIRKFREACKETLPCSCYSCRIPRSMGSVVKRKVNPSAAYQCADSSIY